MPINNTMPDKQESESVDPKKKRKTKKDKELLDQTDKAIDPVLDKVIKQALVTRLKQSKKRNEDIDEMNALVATCQEFMKSFVILGYDLDGDPIQPLIHVSSQQEADAIGTYLSRFVSSSMRYMDPTID